LAVLLVLAAHSSPRLPFGGTGVTVFFVLSGYLITTLLIREREVTGRISRRLFYLRRANRLYPALLTMLVVTVVLGAPVGSALRAGTYTTNLFNSFGIGSFPYGHTWSLAMEEQFYLLWPLLLPGVLRGGRRARALLGLLAMLSCGAGWAFAALTHGGAGVLSFNPLLRAHGPIAGCLLALYLHRRTTPLPRPGLIGGLGLALVAASLAVGLAGSGNPAAFGWNAITPVVGALLLIGGLVGGASGISRLLSAKPAVWMGTRSYAVYLWHYPLIELGQLRGWSLSMAALVGVTASLAVAEISYQWVERPFLRLNQRLHPGCHPTSHTPQVGGR
jgi:peptidoglycan/LPS O-acetylase OafA/YrhL